ncbi:MAG: hypothetical protein K2L86_01850 [Lachnospiraceae bacterium]|nr:hypothetical protein [Lachnospiraceae bacterium]
MKLRIINNTKTALYIFVRPQDTVLASFDAFSAYACSRLSASAAMYAELKNEFYAAGMYQNPDQSVVVTKKLPLAANKHYVLDENGNISMEDRSDASIEIENKNSDTATLLLYGNSTCILQKKVRPDFKVCLEHLPDALCDVMISISEKEIKPDFFPVNQTHMFSFSSQPLPIKAADYMTIKLEENVGSGAIVLSEPDFSPFSNYNNIYRAVGK